MTPYSARVVMRTVGRYASAHEVTRSTSSTGGDGAMCSAWNANLGHLPKIQHFVDLFVGQHMLLFDEITDENILLHRLLAQLGRARVSDLRRERRRESRGTLDPVRAHVSMRFNPLYAALSEHGGSVCENPRREQHVERDDGHHDVELELAVLGGDRHGGVEPHHLEADLVDHLRNRRIDL